MKHINPFDRMIQEQLAQEAEPAPMHLWDDIDTQLTLQDQLEKDKKRRWLLLLLFLFTVSAGAWLSYENFYSNSPENTFTLETQKPTNPAQESDSSLEKMALSAHENQTANSTTNTVSNSLPEKAAKEEIIEKQKVIVSSNELNNQKMATNSTETIATSSIAQKTTNSTTPQLNVPAQKEITTSPDLIENLQITALTGAKSEHKVTPVESKQVLPNTDEEVVVVKSEMNNHESKANHSKTKNVTILPTVGMDEISSMAFTKIDQQEVKTPSEISKLVDTNLKTKTKTHHKNNGNHQQSSDYKALKRFFKIAPNPGSCYSFGGKNFDLRGIYVDALLSSDLPFRTLGTKDSEMLAYKQLRDNSESYYWAGTGGLRLSVVTNSGLAVRTGLVYAQITERLKYENEEAERILTETIIINGDTTVTTVIEQGRRRIEHSNHYNMFDIPLILGYEMETEKLVFNVNAGAYFNLLFTQKGRILSSSFEPVDINNQTMFRKNLGISYFASMGFNYKFTRDLHLVIEPQVRYYPKSFTRDEYAISQKYFNFGVFTGLRFRL